MLEGKYPLVYRLDNDIDLHIEHINDEISTIWFDKEDKKQLIPIEFELYNEKAELVESYQNTQTYIISRDRNYQIHYKNKPIIRIELWMHPCIPPIYKNEIYLIKNEI